ncbi:glycosyltransferase family 2 protein [Flavobacterium sp.]|uniref:glycosyltransferase family 2 protein n=1 Tax=Flavobacterium sp. TaxID=239 RepID=UPI002FDA7130
MLAIVIPYYKQSYFESTLASLSSQTNKNFKVYIGDDASPENPDVLLEKYSGKFDFTYKKFDENLGSKSLTQQWQRCLDLVKDESWVMILGDDDVLGENAVESFYNAADEIANNKCNVIRFATQKINKEGALISEIYNHPVIEKATAFLARMYSGKTRSSLSEYIFNKKILLEKGFANFPLAWHSDVVLVLEVSHFKKVFSINQAVIKVRIAENSITGSDKYNKQKSKADERFGIYLLKQLPKFDKMEQEILMDKIEKSYLNNKKAFALGFSVFSFYITKFRLSEAFAFVSKIVKSI